MQAQNRYYSLDLMRGIAAISVALHHAALFCDIDILSMAYVSVDLFFCLSGFVIEKSYSQRVKSGMSFTEFAKRRLIRLYPMFAIGIMLGMIVISLEYRLNLTDFSVKDIITASTLNLLYLPYENAHHLPRGAQGLNGVIFPLNDPAYSLFFELFINSIFYYLLRGKNHLHPRFIAGLKVVLLALAGIFLVGVVYGRGNSGWGSGYQHFVIGLGRTTFGFYAGVLLAQMPTRKPYSPATGSALLACMVLTFCLLCALESNRVNNLLCVAFVPLSIHIAARIEVVPALEPVARWLGELSYPLYCLHAPILALIYVVYARSDVGGFVAVPLGIPSVVFVIVLCGVVSAAMLVMIDIPVRRYLVGKFIRGPLRA